MESFNLKKIVSYIMKKLKENNKYGRTFVQKITYFFLPENKKAKLFTPYLYGPYSEQIQRMVQFLENNETILNTWSKINEEEKAKIDQIINYILEKNLTPNDFALYSKIDIIQFLLKEQKKKLTKENILDMAENLGWKEIVKNSDLEQIRKNVKVFKKQIQIIN